MSFIQPRRQLLASYVSGIQASGSSRPYMLRADFPIAAWFLMLLIWPSNSIF